MISRRLLAAALLASASLAWSSLAVAQEPSASPVLEAPSPSAVPLDVRPEGSWEVSAYDPWMEGLVEPRANTSLTVSLLTGGRLEGETGCGDYFGGYTIDGERLGLGIISKGYGECGLKRVEEAVAFSVALDAVASWRPGVGGLELLDENGTIRVVLERPLHVDVTGDWLAQRYVRSNGAMTEPLTDAPITLSFHEDGSVGGSSGCRFLEGEYRGEGDNILIGPIDTVGPACKGDERKQERRLFDLFGEIVLWERAADELTFTDAFSGPLLVLAAAATTEPGATAGDGE